MRKVDVIIPTYKPGKQFEELLRRLILQRTPVNRIIVMNTEERYWDKERFEGMFEGSGHPLATGGREASEGSGLTDGGAAPQLTVCHLGREEFDHGETRHEAILKSDAEVVICMTHDCIPCDRDLVGNLLAALESSGDVAAAYGRQLPAADCGVIERYTRQFNYPQESRIKGKGDLDRLGIKTFFCSNVCAAYKRELYLQLGGFTRKTIFNEDMIFAGNAVQAGYRIAYAADARVIHSHNYSAMEQLHRNFDLAVSQADHPEVFAGLKSEGEGIRLVKQTAAWLLKHGYFYLLPRLVIQSGFKYMGYLLGKRYKRLPKQMVLWLTMNSAYWKDADFQ